MNADIEMDMLCESFKKTPFHHEPEIEYERLKISQNLKLSEFSHEFLNSTRARYRSYIHYIDFRLYKEIGEMIELMINDFFNTGDDLKLQACKCQNIDFMMIELIQKENSEAD